MPEPKTVAPVMAGLAQGIDQLSDSLPESMQPIARFLAVALRFGSEAAARGQDPVTKLERLVAADALIAGVHEDWRAELERKFPR